MKLCYRSGMVRFYHEACEDLREDFQVRQYVADARKQDQ